MTLDEHEQWAKERLIELQREYNERARPFVTMLTNIAAMRPPQPFIINTLTLPREVLERLTQKATSEQGDSNVG